MMPSQTHNILKDLNILKKYDVYAYDYIEYPHKSFWSYDLTDKDFRESLRTIFKENPDRGLTVYLHIPFCNELCSFCLCHRQITKHYAPVKHYLENALFLEIDLYCQFFEELGIQPQVKQIYLGGGSPTIVNQEDFDRLLGRLNTMTNLANLDQFHMEIDPRRVDEEQLKFYHSRGVRTLSFGIQDFDPDVQEAVNRIQPFACVEALLTETIRTCFTSINFDILIGLPRQSVKSLRETVEKVVSLKPDRISLTYLFYTPRFHPHQMHMHRHGLLPDFYDRKKLFVTALTALQENGYIRTGFEHFAKPDDRVAVALQKGLASYNSFGATTGEYHDILGLGRASYSTLGNNHYFQWVYEQNQYEEALQAGQFPVLRGHVLSEDDVLRRDIIKTLRTYFSLDIHSFQQKYGLNFFEYFAKEHYDLDEFVRDQLIEVTPERISMTETGKHFANLVCSIFDNYVVRPRFNPEIQTRCLNG
ncbi:MAG: oxygen-independent coproporphyrinogen III oxidase [Magnetococcus sp. YQC-5]